jgi:hypothetical protein
MCLTFALYSHFLPAIVCVIGCPEESAKGSWLGESSKRLIQSNFRLSEDGKDLR